MDPVAEASLIAGRGIEENANQGGRRQVTLIAEEAWREAESELGFEVDPIGRRANLMVRGIDLKHSGGKLLRIGPVLIRLLAETRPCHQMEEFQPGLRTALAPDWRAGAYGEILEGGVIRVGEGARWEAEVKS